MIIDRTLYTKIEAMSIVKNRESWPGKHLLWLQHEQLVICHVLMYMKTNIFYHKFGKPSPCLRSAGKTSDLSCGPLLLWLPDWDTFWNWSFAVDCNNMVWGQHKSVTCTDNKVVHLAVNQQSYSTMGQLDCLSVWETWDVPFTWPGALKNHQSSGKRATALLCPA